MLFYPDQASDLPAIRRDREAPVPGTGSKIYFADGHENVEYNQVAEMDASRSGDPVQLCVHLLPAGPPSCPADDTRGIVYRVKNLADR
ncbi:hypothetical protein ACRAWD_04560 [Caulobacter segnis]